MQTFLPYPCFVKSARCLDRQRLGKQRVEVLTILRVLKGVVNAWQNHPAVRMWRGYEKALALYGRAICREWRSRGYRDNCSRQILKLVGGRIGVPKMPPWLGRRDFHRSHKSNLLRKDAEHYKRFLGKTGDDLPYVWPV